MPDGASHLKQICGTENQNCCGDVVFVHGLNGDAHTTWHPEGQPEQFWPKWIGEDLPDVEIWSVSYPVNAFAWQGSSMPLADRAINILGSLKTNGIGTNRPVVFITHSMGGLLVKEMLRKATDGSVPEGEELAHSTRGVVFLSTPHSGADLANFVDFLKVLLPNDIVRELRPNEPRLRELNVWYCNNVGKLGIKTQVYRETRPTRAGQGLLRGRFEAIVVDANSANPGIPGVTAWPVDYDHITISRPERKSDLYRDIKKFVNTSLRSSGGGGDSPVLSETSPSNSLNDQELEHPNGVVRLDSRFYIEPDCLQQCQQIIEQRSALLRVQAPYQMGKTSLLERLVQHAEGLNYRIARIDFRLVDQEATQNLGQFLQWFCQRICSELNLEIVVKERWSIYQGSKDNCTEFIETILRRSSPQTLLLCLDNLEGVFAYRELTDGFTSMLRCWHDKQELLWQELRLTIFHVCYVESNDLLNGSPLNNVGQLVRLPELNLSQVQNLVHLHDLNWSAQQIAQLMKLVGGHPFLIRKALYCVATGEISLEDVLAQAHFPNGLYGDHLQGYFRYLEDHPDLRQIMQQVVQSPEPLFIRSRLLPQLVDLGLIKYRSNLVEPANQLYRSYFRNWL